MAIIGVVAAITIPTVVRNYQKHQTVTKLKKVYTTLNQAVTMSKIENGSPKNWNYKLGNVDFAEKYLIPYLKIGKNCRTNTAGNCNFKVQNNHMLVSLDNYSSYFCNVPTAKFYLKDGTFIALCASGVADNYDGYSIFANISGKNGVMGKDIFVFEIRDKFDNVIPWYITYKKWSRKFLLQDDLRACKKDNFYAYFCTLVIMLDGWQIKDDYPW